MPNIQLAVDRVGNLVDVSQFRSPVAVDSGVHALRIGFAGYDLHGGSGVDLTHNDSPFLVPYNPIVGDIVLEIIISSPKAIHFDLLR